MHITGLLFLFSAQLYINHFFATPILHYMLIALIVALVDYSPSLLKIVTASSLFLIETGIHRYSIMLHICLLILAIMLIKEFKKHIDSLAIIGIFTLILLCICKSLLLLILFDKTFVFWYYIFEASITILLYLIVLKLTVRQKLDNRFYFT